MLLILKGIGKEILILNHLLVLHNSRLIYLLRRTVQKFTLNVFYEIQEEIVASVFYCVVSDFKKDGDDHCYHVRSIEANEYVVIHSISTEDLSCSCNKFMRVGLLCSHLFTVLRTIGKQTVPEKYVLPRWTKKRTLKPVFEIDDSVFKIGVELDERKLLVSELMSEMHTFVNIIEDDTEGIKSLLNMLKQEKNLYMHKMQIDSTSATDNNHLKRFENFIGPIPGQVDVLPPPKAKNKGRPKEKRLKSIGEKVIAQASKEPRLCGSCNKPGHNSRTCKKDN